MPRPKIVVLGGGFGGMAAIRALKDVNADIILADRTNHFLFQPLLYQVATAALSPADIATAGRAMLRGYPNVAVWMANVTGISTTRRVVQFENNQEISYDYLIVAVGVKYSFFGHDEWAPYVQVLKTLPNALAIRENILAAFERAEISDDLEQIQRLLTFVVVGAGPTGVELAGTIAELARSTLVRDFKHINPKSARIILCEAGNRVLAGFPEKLATYGANVLRDLGIELRLGEAVTAIDEHGVTIGDTMIETGSILWCAGTTAGPIANWIGAKTAKNGTVEVSSDCSVAAHPEIFVIGDAASFVTNSGQALPGLAPVAKQQGAYVGKLLKQRVHGKPSLKPFRYRNYGTMAVIGRSRAVADFGRITLTGLLAWLAWSMVHLMLLTDFRSRMLVFVNWAWAWFTYGRGSRLLIGNLPPPGGKKATSDGPIRQ